MTPFFTFSSLHQNLSIFNPNIVHKLSEIMVGSRIRRKPIPDPGSSGQKGTDARIRIRTTIIFCNFQSRSLWVRLNEFCEVAGPLSPSPSHSHTSGSPSSLQTTWPGPFTYRKSKVRYGTLVARDISQRTICKCLQAFASG